MMINESENLDLSDASNAKKKCLKRKQGSFNSNESSDLSDDVFYTYTSNNQTESITVAVVKPQSDNFQQNAPSTNAQVVSSCRRKKRDNLKTKKLTLPQLFRLARTRYWNIPNFIRLLIVLGRYDFKVCGFLQ